MLSETIEKKIKEKKMRLAELENYKIEEEEKEKLDFETIIYIYAIVEAATIILKKEIKELEAIAEFAKQTNKTYLN